MNYGWHRCVVQKKGPAYCVCVWETDFQNQRFGHTHLLIFNEKVLQLARISWLEAAALSSSVHMCQWSHARGTRTSMPLTGWWSYLYCVSNVWEGFISSKPCFLILLVRTFFLVSIARICLIFWFCLVICFSSLMILVYSHPVFCSFCIIVLLCKVLIDLLSAPVAYLVLIV